jgi:antirestriction protein ArdC
MRSDVYERITGQIVAQLEKGVRPWMKPWDAAHAAGPVSKPLRHNGHPYICRVIPTVSPSQTAA